MLTLFVAIATCFSVHYSRKQEHKYYERFFERCKQLHSGVRKLHFPEFCFFYFWISNRVKILVLCSFEFF